MSRSIIHKYQLAPVGGLDLPSGARILSVGRQKESVYLWALVDPDADTVHRDIEVHVTGQTVDDPDGLDYIGTAHGVDGWLVLHVFEREQA